MFYWLSFADVSEPSVRSIFKGTMWRMKYEIKDLNHAHSTPLLDVLLGSFIHSSYSHPISLISLFILSYNIRLGVLCGLVPSDFRNKV
jgi:hypothetical protein